MWCVGFLWPIQLHFLFLISYLILTNNALLLIVSGHCSYFNGPVFVKLFFGGLAAFGLAMFNCPA